MNAPDKDFDLERDIAEGVFERANLMSIARGDGEIVAVDRNGFRWQYLRWG